jgi:hypothetical protein
MVPGGEALGSGVAVVDDGGGVSHRGSLALPSGSPGGEDGGEDGGGGGDEDGGGVADGDEGRSGSGVVSRGGGPESAESGDWVMTSSFGGGRLCAEPSLHRSEREVEDLGGADRCATPRRAGPAPTT